MEGYGGSTSCLAKEKGNPLSDGGKKREEPARALFFPDNPPKSFKHREWEGRASKKREKSKFLLSEIPVVENGERKHRLSVTTLKGRQAIGRRYLECGLGLPHKKKKKVGTNRRNPGCAVLAWDKAY